jgi:predicted ester cyclase
MSESNKQILERANAAVAADDYEEFLSYSTEDTEWNFIGERVLKGKEAVRRYMQETYIELPKFEVSKLISEDDFVVAVGKISMGHQTNMTIVTSGSSGRASCTS